MTPPSQSGSASGSGASEEPAISYLDSEALAEALRERRESSGLSIRTAAGAAGVSFMTLSRVEAGGQPDLATFLRLCAWLRVPPETFFITGAPRDTETPEIVATHLLADPRLEREAASRIASVVRDMYAVLASEPLTPVTLTCHLRAAATLRPGVPERLGELLGTMHDRLMELEAEGTL